MKLFSVFASLALVAVGQLYGAEAEDFAAVKAADEQRIATTIASNTTDLAKLLSDDLYYGNADGRVQTKAQFLAAAAGNKAHYTSVVPLEIGFQAIASGVVAMNGITRLTARANQQVVEFRIRFLAVWRKESGQWKLLSYQSSQIPKN